MFFCVLSLYIMIGSAMEHAKLPVGHETGAIILLGIAISFITKAVKAKDQDLSEIVFLNWSNDLFFSMLLPLIIFATGFNLRRRKFFENMANISKLGILGTILTFVIYSILTWAFF